MPLLPLPEPEALARRMQGLPSARELMSLINDTDEHCIFVAQYTRVQHAHTHTHTNTHTHARTHTRTHMHACTRTGGGTRVAVAGCDAPVPIEGAGDGRQGRGAAELRSGHQGGARRVCLLCRAAVVLLQQGTTLCHCCLACLGWASGRCVCVCAFVCVCVFCVLLQSSRPLVGDVWG